MFNSPDIEITEKKRSKSWVLTKIYLQTKDEKLKLYKVHAPIHRLNLSNKASN